MACARAASQASLLPPTPQCPGALSEPRPYLTRGRGFPSYPSRVMLMEHVPTLLAALVVLTPVVAASPPGTPPVSDQRSLDVSDPVEVTASTRTGQPRAPSRVRVLSNNA